MYTVRKKPGQFSIFYIGDPFHFSTSSVNILPYNFTMLTGGRPYEWVYTNRDLAELALERRMHNSWYYYI